MVNKNFFNKILVLFLILAISTIAINGVQADNDREDRYNETDFVDSDSDGDGILTTQRVDSKNRSIVKELDKSTPTTRQDIDSDGDGRIDVVRECPDDQELVRTQDGEVRCQVKSVDRETQRIRDFSDADSDGDAILDERERAIRREAAARNARASLDKATPKLYLGLNPEDLNESEKQRLRAYISSLEEVRGQDFGLSVALAASNNSRVREIRYDNQTNTVEVEHDREVRLLGFIKMNARARTIISEDGETVTRMPWWNFIATNNDSDEEIQELARTRRNPTNNSEEVDILGMQDEK